MHDTWWYIRKFSPYEGGGLLFLGITKVFIYLLRKNLAILPRSIKLNFLFNGFVN